jgi:thioredoxin 1
MSNSLIQQGTDKNFNKVVTTAKEPVLVDFWAPWCAPCRMVTPILEEVATEYKGRAKVVKINVDREQRIAGQMGIRSIPTIALFKDGKVQKMLVGLQSKERYFAMLEKALK